MSFPNNQILLAMIRLLLSDDSDSFSAESDSFSDDLDACSDDR